MRVLMTESYEPNFMSLSENTKNVQRDWNNTVTGLQVEPSYPGVLSGTNVVDALYKRALNVCGVPGAKKLSQRKNRSVCP